MANTTLTVDKILRATYAVMHQKSNFIMKTNRQYDPEFQRRELKQGQSLRVRLPAKFTVRTGNTMSAQNYVERKVDLPLATIKGVDLNFGQEELTFSIEDFTERVIAPAASQLIASVEADAFSMYKQVANFVGIVTTTAGSGLTYSQFQTAGRYLSEGLAPVTDRTACINPESRVTFSTDVKGLFQSSSAIEQQYVEGLMGRTGGFDVYENTIVPAHTSGTFTSAAVLVTTSTAADAGDAGTGNAWQGGNFNLMVDGLSAGAYKAGDIFTVANVYDVHPETKQSTGVLKRFVLQEDATWSATRLALPVKPYPIYGGAYQNVNAAIANNAAVTFLGPATTDSAITYGQNLFFHKDAFAFVTADLLDPSEFGAWGGRRVEDNISLRIWRQGDIANGNFPCRLDIAYGYAALYPEWACRHVHVRT